MRWLSSPVTKQIPNATPRASPRRLVSRGERSGDVNVRRAEGRAAASSAAGQGSVRHATASAGPSGVGAAVGARRVNGSGQAREPSSPPPSTGCGHARPSPAAMAARSSARRRPTRPRARRASVARSRTVAGPAERARRGELDLDVTARPEQAGAAGEPAGSPPMPMLPSAQQDARPAPVPGQRVEHVAAAAPWRRAARASRTAAGADVDAERAGGPRAPAPRSAGRGRSRRRGSARHGGAAGRSSPGSVVPAPAGRRRAVVHPSGRRAADRDSPRPASNTAAGAAASNSRRGHRARGPPGSRRAGRRATSRRAESAANRLAVRERRDRVRVGGGVDVAQRRQRRRPAGRAAAAPRRCGRRCPVVDIGTSRSTAACGRAPQAERPPAAVRGRAEHRVRARRGEPAARAGQQLGRHLRGVHPDQQARRVRRARCRRRRWPVGRRGRRRAAGRTASPAADRVGGRRATRTRSVDRCGAAGVEGVGERGGGDRGGLPRACTAGRAGS